MSTLISSESKIRKQCKEDFYILIDNQRPHKFSPEPPICYMVDKPVRSKYFDACEIAIKELFVKYNLTENDRWNYRRRYESWKDTLVKFNGNMDMFTNEWRGVGESDRAFKLNKAYEKVIKWNRTKTLLYIIEARIRYKDWGHSPRYSVKYDNHLYEFCCLFANYYYGEKGLEKRIADLVQNLYDETSNLYDSLTKYISSIVELKFLRGIQDGTSSLTIDQFKSRYAYK